MYKRIDFSKLEGLATYQDTLDFLQTSYRDAISAIAKAFGSRVIVTGVTDQGATYSDGWIVIDGELMPFAGGLKTDRLIIEDVTDTEVFGNGSVQTVYYTRRAKLGITGGYAFSDFIRVDTMSAISEGLKNLIGAHNNLQAMFNNLQTAHNNLQAAHNNLEASHNSLQNSYNGHTHPWGQITDKPTVLSVLHRGSEHIWDTGNGGNDSTWIPFNTDIGTTSYLVIGNLISLTGGANGWDIDNDVFWSVKNRATNGFTLLLRDVNNNTQNQQFEYIIVPLF
jgi:hypothetical protein